jgi:glucose-6-phosphate dehydrogenase assembly protein OpcA
MAATVEAEPGNPSADLLAAWLRSKLKVDIIRKISSGPGITAVRLGTAAGDIAITRPDGLLASYAVPGQPERLVALKRRDFTELITEELRRMDADDVFERALRALVPETAKATATKQATASKKAAKRHARSAAAKRAPAP